MTNTRLQTGNGLSQHTGLHIEVAQLVWIANTGLQTGNGVVGYGSGVS
jgi:hypothetical protein